MLTRRASELRELMDDPDCDPRLLYNTYRQFALVNRLVSGWGRVLRRYLVPRLVGGSRVLDIGCGGGDLVRRVAAWGVRRGVPLHVTGIDPDPRALSFATSRPSPPGVEFLQADAFEMAGSGRRFDLVLSNHLLHHLTAAEVERLLEASALLTAGVAVHNDLRRHGAAWLAFALCRPLFRRSFIVDDGLRSIRRAFTPAELQALLPAGWRVEQIAPFRNLLILER